MIVRPTSRRGRQPHNLREVIAALRVRRQEAPVRDVTCPKTQIRPQFPQIRPKFALKCALKWRSFPRDFSQRIRTVLDP